MESSSSSRSASDDDNSDDRSSRYQDSDCDCDICGLGFDDGSYSFGQDPDFDWSDYYNDDDDDCVIEGSIEYHPYYLAPGFVRYTGQFGTNIGIRSGTVLTGQDNCNICMEAPTTDYPIVVCPAGIDGGCRGSVCLECVLLWAHSLAYAQCTSGQRHVFFDLENDSKCFLCNRLGQWTHPGTGENVLKVWLNVFGLMLGGLSLLSVFTWVGAKVLVVSM